MNEPIDSLTAQLVTTYGEQGEAAASRLRKWLSGEVKFSEPEILKKHLSSENLSLVFDAFWQVLPFGTGGRRGRVGYGPNRMNLATVALTIQGHCDFLKAKFLGRSDLCVVVANDVRVFNDVAGTYKFLGASHPLLGVSSRSLAKLAAEIYAGNGIVAYLPDPEDDAALLSTPELSFIIGQVQAAGGINMSASHNPPDDNGVKVYDEHGSQPVAPEDQLLLDIMAKVSRIDMVDFATARSRGLIKPVPGDLHEKYLHAYQQLYRGFFPPRSDMPIVYTPLCGVGLTTSGDLLPRLGFPVLVPPNEGPDGSFKVIPFKSPNPEVPQSTEPARAFAEQQGSGIVLSSDPDADRVGLEARLADGSWYHFDGNQIAAILAYALMLDPKGPRRSGLVIETLVTTKLLGRIAEARGDSDVIDDLLVGFKYVADVLKKLKKDGKYGSIVRRPDELVLAAEESHGVVAIPTILDKDSIPACMWLAGLYQRLKVEGRTLLDYYVAILEELGGYDTVSRSIMMAGAAGMERKDRIMAWLRKSPPKNLGGHDVQRVVDYWDTARFGPIKSDSEWLPRNVVQLFTQRFVITVRPSGTEPKLKFYLQLLPGAVPMKQKGIALLDAIRAEADAAARGIYNALLQPLDVSLGEVGLWLTDLIELDRKIDLEQKVIPALYAKLQAGSFSDLQTVKTWLRDQSSTLLPGADALPALKAPLRALAPRWKIELAGAPVAQALLSWAQE